MSNDYYFNTHLTDDLKSYFNEHTLPNYFYQCLFGELIKIFGIEIIVPDEYYLAEYDDEGNVLECEKRDYAYEDQISFNLTCVCSTCGWNTAFKETCIQCGFDDVYEYYSALDWDKSDLFDGVIEDNMIDVVFSGDKKDSYYSFKIHGGV